MAQQTAVEWLIDQLKIRGYAGEFPPHLLFEKAKQMEKEQIMKAFLYAKVNYRKDWADQYYNETYGKE